MGVSRTDFTINLLETLLFVQGLNALPGCNPVQDGPGRAIPSTGCNAPTTFIP